MSLIPCIPYLTPNKVVHHYVLRFQVLRLRNQVISQPVWKLKNSDKPRDAVKQTVINKPHWCDFFSNWIFIIVIFAGSTFLKYFTVLHMLHSNNKNFFALTILLFSFFYEQWITTLSLASFETACWLMNYTAFIHLLQSSCN